MSNSAKKHNIFSTPYLTRMAILTAVASILFLVEIPIVAFYKLDISNIPVLLGAFSMGTVPGLIILALKSAIGLLHSSSAGVGELADFIMGAALQLIFGIKLKWLPVAKWAGFKYTILPSCALAFYTMASVSRTMRASMLEVVQQDYIKTARAKGLSNFRITWKHQIRNAIMPVITIMGPTVAAVLTGTFVIESMYAIPGMGKYYVDSTNNNDYSMILGMTVFYGAFLIFCNLVVDILYGIVDPRVRIGK